MHGDPLTLHAALREEVRRFAGALGTRRCAPPTVHVGFLGGERVSWPHDPAQDAGLRADLVTRALEAFGQQGCDPTGPVLWLARCGPVSLTDVDQLWFAAALTGFGRHGLLPRGYALTRRSWLDLGTGESRSWRRLRPLDRSHGRAQRAGEPQSQL